MECFALPITIFMVSIQWDRSFSLVSSPKQNWRDGHFIKVYVLAAIGKKEDCSKSLTIKNRKHDEWSPMAMISRSGNFKTGWTRGSVTWNCLFCPLQLIWGDMLGIEVHGTEILLPIFPEFHLLNLHQNLRPRGLKLASCPARSWNLKAEYPRPLDDDHHLEEVPGETPRLVQEFTSQPEDKSNTHFYGEPLLKWTRQPSHSKLPRELS